MADNNVMPWDNPANVGARPWADQTPAVINPTTGLQVGEKPKDPNVPKTEYMPWDSPGAVTLPQNQGQYAPEKALPIKSPDNSLISYLTAPLKGAISDPAVPWESPNLADLRAKSPSFDRPSNGDIPVPPGQTPSLVPQNVRNKYTPSYENPPQSSDVDTGKPKDQIEAGLQGAGKALANPLTYMFGPAGAATSVASSAVTDWRNAASPSTPGANTVLGMLTGIFAPTAINTVGPRKANALTESWDALGMKAGPTAAGIGAEKSFPRTIRFLRESFMPNPLERREREGREALGRNAEGLANDLGTSETREEAGNKLVELIGDPKKVVGWVGEKERELGNNARRLDTAVPPQHTPIDVRNLANDLRSAVATERGAIQGDPSGSAFVEEMIKSLDNNPFYTAGGIVPLSVIQSNLRTVGDKLKGGLFENSIEGKRNLNKLWGILSEYEKKAYIGTPYEAEYLGNKANWSQYFKDREYIKDYINKEGGPAYNKIMAGKQSGGEKLDNVFGLSPELSTTGRGEVASNALREMGSGPDGWNPDRFFKAWTNAGSNKMSPEAKQALFGDADGDIPKIYDQLAKAAEEQARSEKARNFSGTAGTSEAFHLARRFLTNIAAIAVPAGGVAAFQSSNATDLPETAATAGLAGMAGYAGVMGIGPRLFSNPSFVRFLAKDPPIQQIPMALRAIAAAHPEIAKELTLFGKYVEDVKNNGLDEDQQPVNRDIKRPNMPLERAGNYLGDKVKSGADWLKGKLGYAEGGAVGDDYNTPLSVLDELQFQHWKQQYAPNDSGADYDLRGAYKSGFTPDPITNHWKDEFKKPNHPTFSNESKYSRENPDLPAGSWMGENFIPPGEYAEGGPVDMGGNTDIAKELIKKINKLDRLQSDIINEPPFPSFERLLNKQPVQKKAEGGLIEKDDEAPHQFGAGNNTDLAVLDMIMGSSPSNNPSYSENDFILRENPMTRQAFGEEAEATFGPQRDQGMMEMMQRRMNPEIELAEGGAVDRFSQAVQYLTKETGMPEHAARGAVKYMYKNESKLDPNIVNPTSKALGIGQWLGNRKTALLNTYGSRPTYENQLEHIKNELNGPERKTLQALLASKDEKQGYDAWGRLFERPGEAALAKAGVNYSPGDIKVTSNSTSSKASNNSIINQIVPSSPMAAIEDEEDQPNQHAAQLAEEHAAATDDPLVQAVIKTIWSHADV